MSEQIDKIQKIAAKWGLNNSDVILHTGTPDEQLEYDFLVLQGDGKPTRLVILPSVEGDKPLERNGTNVDIPVSSYVLLDELERTLE